MLRRKRKGPAPVVPLVDAVRGVAACPCGLHQDSFVASLAAADRVYLRLMDPAAPVPADGEAEGLGDQVEVATAVDPQGVSFLYAFTDLEAAQGSNPDARFVSVAPEVAFHLALSNGNQGLLVTTAGPRDDWAAVTADGVARLLAGQ